MKALRDCKAGSTVTVGGQQWQVLEHFDNGGTFCIRKDLLDGYKPFDRDNCNDWNRSSLREYLNGEYKEALLQAVKTAEGVEILLNVAQDLTADDGLTEYGSSTDKVTMLTCEQYRKYRNLFDEINDWWWLITADSPINHFARSVNTDGTLDSDIACDGYDGVRPACMFNSSIHVEVADE